MGKQWKHWQTLFGEGGSKITADGDCSHGIKRHLLLGRKVMTNLDSILKSRNILPTLKVHIVKTMVFPVVIYGCESCTIKKAEHQRIEAFELWCWRGLLRVPWTARRSNQSILKEISLEYSLEGQMLKQKLHYFVHLRWTDSLEETLMLGRIEGGRRRDDRGWDGWMASPTRWTWVWANWGRYWRTGKPSVLQSVGPQSQTWVSDWTEAPRSALKVPLTTPAQSSKRLCSSSIQILIHSFYQSKRMYKEIKCTTLHNKWRRRDSSWGGWLGFWPKSWD